MTDLAFPDRRCDKCGRSVAWHWIKRSKQRRKDTVTYRAYCCKSAYERHPDDPDKMVPVVDPTAIGPQGKVSESSFAWETKAFTQGELYSTMRLVGAEPGTKIEFFKSAKPSIEVAKPASCQRTLTEMLLATA